MASTTNPQVRKKIAARKQSLPPQVVLSVSSTFPPPVTPVGKATEVKVALTVRLGDLPSFDGLVKAKLTSSRFDEPRVEQARFELKTDPANKFKVSWSFPFNVQPGLNTLTLTVEVYSDKGVLVCSNGPRIESTFGE